VTDAYLRNSLAAFTTSTVDPANIERIEAIKGPSATLFGSSLTSYGGLFNRVTKKPLDTFHTEITYIAGGYGLSRLTADINAPLNEDKTALFRVNIADHNEGSFQDAGFNHLLFVAPSLTYQVNQRLSASVDAEIYHQTNSAQFRFFPETEFTVTTPQQLHFDYNRSFTSNDLTASNPSTNVIAQVNYKFSDTWRSSTNFAYSTSTGNGIWAWESVLPGDSTVSRTEEDQIQSYTNFQLQQNFLGDFYTGSVRHRLVAGLDVYGYQDNVSYGGVLFDSVRISGPDPEYSKLNQKSLDAALANTSYSHDIDKQYTYAAYASDVINITDKLIAMLSLRVDHFVSKGDNDLVADTTTGGYNQTALSPKLGLVYQVIKNRLSLFGNYMNGFQNQTGEDHNHHPFKPQQANQWESGVKANFLDGRLSGTLSYYDIRVKDILRTDPDFPSFDIQNGTQYSKGVEAELTANPVDGLNIVAGYAHNDSKYGDIDPTLDGYRPGSAGPADVANLWISYRLQQGSVKGLGLGFGGNYGGKDNIVNESDGYFTLPSYTVFNASVSYDQPKYRAALKLDNFTNKEYWVGWYTIIPQMPRRLSVSLTYRF
jgi:iron complex outermembrane receptor protein